MNFTNGGYNTYFYDSSFAVKWVCLANLTTNLQAGSVTNVAIKEIDPFKSSKPTI